MTRDGQAAPGPVTDRPVLYSLRQAGMAAGMLAADAAAWRVDAARRSELLVDDVRATISEGLRSELIQGALAPLEDRLAALEGAVSASDAAVADGIDRATRTIRRSLEVCLL